MFNIGVFQKNPAYLADLLPWTAFVAPGVILNKDGSFQRSYSFRGPDLESASDEEMSAAMAQINNCFKRLGSGWALYVEARRESSDCAMPERQEVDKLTLLIDLEHHKRFSENSFNFASRYYLTLQFLPAPSFQKSIAQNFIKQVKVINQQEQQSLQEFILQTDRIFTILKDICYEAEPLSDEETLTYLHATISGKNHPVAVPKTPIYLDALLADTPLLTGIDPQLGDEFLKTITILGFPSESFPAILDRLNYLPFGYRWVTRYIALDKLEAEAQLKRHRQRWFAKRKSVFNLLQEVLTKQESALQDQGAIAHAKEVDEALYPLSSDTVSYGYFTCTITVKHRDKDQAREMALEVERIINGLGFTTILESLNAQEAWLSSLPGQAYANVRKPLLHSLNLAHLLPYSAIWAGQASDQHLHSSPLFYAYTYGNTPFRFVLHVDGVGHLMIIGPTGAGKSVLLNFIAVQYRRYPQARVIVFDKGRSFLALTRGLQGQFYELGKENDLHFQPLAYINQDSERLFALNWLQGLVQECQITLTAEINESLWQALVSLAQFPAEHRTLTGLVALLQHAELRQALEQFTLNGAFGGLLDAAQDQLQKGNWLCFEMENLMNMPKVLAPVLSYLFHRLETDFNGEPTILVLDEAWLFLTNAVFGQQISGWLKSLRKKNVSVIFATQSVADIANHPLAATLLESCPGRIFLPNPKALEPQTRNDYQRLGLNDKQLALLTHATPKKHYYYNSKLGDRLFSLELGELALAFCGASSSRDLQFIVENMQDDHQAYLQKYLTYKKINWAEELITI